MQKRTIEIKIRLTPTEYQSMIERKTKARLAEWLREVGLGQELRRKAKEVDPKLLFELNRIGVNLNQIAKHCNQYQGNIDLVSIGITLRNIEAKLSEVMEYAKK